MKNFIVLSFFLLSISISSYSQTEWAPIGAKWSNEMDDWWDYRFSYETFTSVKDTLILNKQCRKIEVYTCFHDSLKHKTTIGKGYFFTYTENDKVYYSYKDTFLLLYDFSLKAGDTLVIPKLYPYWFRDSLITKYLIDTIDYVNISGKMLQRQKLHFLEDSVNKWDDDNYIDGYIIEKIGCEKYMFGFPKVMIDEYGPPHLKCYSDGEISYKYRYSANCDGFDGISESLPTEELNLFPNPAYDELFLNYSGNKPYNIEIINSLGIIMLEQNNQLLDRFSINIQNYPKGIYYLILYNDKTRLTKKFVKL